MILIYGGEEVGEMMWREGKREGGGRDERYGESEIEMWETLAGLAGWLLVGDLALPCLVRSQRPESRLRLALVLTVRLSDPISLPALITGTPRAHGLVDDAHPSIPRVYPSRSTNLLTSPTLANKITIHSLSLPTPNFNISGDPISAITLPLLPFVLGRSFPFPTGHPSTNRD